jgi:putative ABC transport system permease protein
MNVLLLSWKNLINKPLSMLLSLILFALGVGLISMLLLLNKQIQEKFDKNLADIDLVIGAKGSPLQLILCSMYHIDAPTGNISIKEAKPFLNPKHPLIKKAVPLSLGDSHKGYRIVGTLHSFLELYKAEIGEGTLWEKDFDVTIGAGVAKDLNLKVGDKFHSSHGFVLDDNLVHDDGDMFKVVGILKPTGSVADQLILTNTQSIWKTHDHGNPTEEDHDHEGHGHEEEIQSDEPKPLIEEVGQDITSLLIQFKNRNYQTLNMARSINENTDMQAANPPIEINRLHAMVGVGEEALRSLALIIVFVSGLSIFISLFDSLRDRRYELALMRVMGASRSKLFTIIILEGVLLAAIGFAIGIFLSHVGMEVLANFMKSSYRYSFSGMVFLKEEIFLLLGALSIGILAAIIPAIQASRTDISKTLTDS